jgi:hypothetical protein
MPDGHRRAIPQVTAVDELFGTQAAVLARGAGGWLVVLMDSCRQQMPASCRENAGGMRARQGHQVHAGIRWGQRPAR